MVRIDPGEQTTRFLMSQVSTQMADKRAVVRELTASVEESADDLAKGLEKLLFGDDKPDELTVKDVVLALPRVLARDFEAYEERETEVAMANALEDQLRLKRDGVMVDLRGTTGHGRNVSGSFYGEEVVSYMGLKGKTPETPEDLISFSSYAVGQLKGGFGAFTPLGGLSHPDLSPIINAMDSQTKALKKVKDDLDTAKSKRQNAIIRRNEVLEDWTRHAGPITTVVESLLKIIEMEEHAKKVRAKKRRKSAKGKSKSEDAPKEEVVKAEETEKKSKDLDVVDPDVDVTVVDEDKKTTKDETSKEEEKPTSPVS